MDGYSAEGSRDAERRPLADKLTAHEIQMIEIASAQIRGLLAGPSSADAQLGMMSSALESKIRSFNIDKRPRRKQVTYGSDWFGAVGRGRARSAPPCLRVLQLHRR